MDAVKIHLKKATFFACITLRVFFSVLQLLRTNPVQTMTHLHFGCQLASLCERRLGQNYSIGIQCLL